MKTITVVGGDLRQVYLAQAFVQSGYTVYAVGFDAGVELPEGIIAADRADIALLLCDAVVFPLPMTLDGKTVNTPLSEHTLELTQCAKMLPAECLVFGGRVDENTQAVFERTGHPVEDYFKREEFAVHNAQATAEGAVEIILRELPTTIYGRNILVTGFGRISKALVRILTAMGAKVTVSARKYGDLAWAEIYGCEGVHISDLGLVIGKQDVVVNTVPAVVLPRKMLSRLDPGCLVVDLASKPGGVDFDTAKQLGLKTIWALSLPGKAAPVTAGEIIKNTIVNMIAERRETDGKD
ncbi:dipicolinate synthase subunit DpsA [Zongyangia hominis]|nr:dipicolinate synthase subunit DpsA [Zongyangia hominis]